MPVGLEVYNNDGLLQVTENYRNYLFDTKMTITGTLIVTWPRYGYFYTVVVANGSMVAFKGVGNSFVGLHSATIGATNTTYEFFSPNISGPTPSATFYVFSTDKQPPNVPYGLEVYDSSGGLVFSSNSLYMKPTTAWSGSSYLTGMSDQNIPGRAAFYGRVVQSSVGANAAVVVASPSGNWAITVFGDGDGTYYWDEDIRGLTYGILNGNLYAAEDLLGGRSSTVAVPSPPPPGSYEFLEYYGLLIDITGL